MNDYRQSQKRHGMANSLRALMRSFIDYAGLFPPAQLEMNAAVEQYAAYRRSEHAWMLGRFVLPVSRLDEFAREAVAHWSKSEQEPRWLISALCSAQAQEAIATIMEFNERHSAFAFIDTLELKADRVDEVERAMQLVPPFVAAYIEIPLAPSAEPLIEAIARTGARAKVRTGGLIPEMIPSTGDLVRFIAGCAAANVPFKATAGLHHPIRSVHRMTYEPDSPSGLMHGFLNVALTSAFLRYGMSHEQAAQVLDETSADAFQFDDEGVAWHEWRLSIEQLVAAREGFCISFGSCSVSEPIEDLKRLGLL
ncbi:MAG: hypothetical protein RMM98_14855 [Acidobacteriota bacterium]|nr:hypothetical protein [Blastocatellia bacterium]MDW8240887.1 hypothetical protein [Acidobacteriota bacterium]